MRKGQLSRAPYQDALERLKFRGEAAMRDLRDIAADMRDHAASVRNQGKTRRPPTLRAARRSR